ncbi:MAG: amino acid racemase [bacterium]|nr:amino acid racemase [bacterium]
MEKKVIGIVGGVGPYAGLDLHKKILDNTQALNDQEHLPVLHLSFSERINDRTQFLLGKVDNPAPAVADIILRMYVAGADVIGIPCNTMHSPQIFNVINERLIKTGFSGTLLNMIEEVAKYVSANYPDVKTIGVLSTIGTFRSKVYPAILEAKGFKVVVLDEDVQNMVHNAIYDETYGIKAQSSPVTEKARGEFLRGVQHLQKKGAQAVILGCTEIPLAITEKEIDGTIMIDPTLILARALINATYPEKLQPIN